MKRKTLSLNGRRLKKSKPSDLFRLSVTYDIVTPESAEVGDHAESGFEYEPRAASLSDVLSALKEYYCFENYSESGSSLSLYCTDPSENYRTGERTYHAVHVCGSERSMMRLRAALKALTNNNKLSIYELKRA